MADVKVVFDAADDYERFMGRWSRAVGEKFLAWLAPPKNAAWLDIGCGTGAFSELIVKHCAPKSVAGIDPSPAQIAHAEKHIGRVDFRVGDSMEIPCGGDEFDVVVSALVLHFIPDRGKAFAEMKRVARPGGIVAGYTWERTATGDHAPYVPMARGIASLGVEAKRAPLVPEAGLDGLQASLKAADYKEIAVTQIEATQGFKNFEEFWEINTFKFHPVGQSIAALGDEQRRALQEKMKSTLPTAKDGSISYSARAVAFKARK